MNPDYRLRFDQSALALVGIDDEGEPCVFEFTGSRFFIGTAYQPERLALAGQTHPLIAAFLNAAAVVK